MPLCCRLLARAPQRNTQTRRKTDAQSAATLPRGEAERNLDAVVVAAAVELQSQSQSSCSRSRSRNCKSQSQLLPLPQSSTPPPNRRPAASRFTTTATPVRRKKPSLGVPGAPKRTRTSKSLQVSNPPSLQRHTHSRTRQLRPKLPPTYHKPAKKIPSPPLSRSCRLEARDKLDPTSQKLEPGTVLQLAPTTCAHAGLLPPLAHYHYPSELSEAPEVCLSVVSVDPSTPTNGVGFFDSLFSHFYLFLPFSASSSLFPFFFPSPHIHFFCASAVAPFLFLSHVDPDPRCHSLKASPHYGPRALRSLSQTRSRT